MSNTRVTLKIFLKYCTCILSRYHQRDTKWTSKNDKVIINKSNNFHKAEQIEYKDRPFFINFKKQYFYYFRSKILTENPVSKMSRAVLFVLLVVAYICSKYLLNIQRNILHLSDLSSVSYQFLFFLLSFIYCSIANFVLSRCIQ